MKISFSKAGVPAKGAVIVTAFSNRKLSPSAAEVDEASGGAVTRAMANSRFKGDKGQSLEIVAPGGTSLSRVLVMGLGTASKLTDLDIEAMGGSALAKLWTRSQNPGTRGATRRWRPSGRFCAAIALISTAPRKSPSASPP